MEEVRGAHGSMPDYIAPSVQDIDYGLLIKRGVRHLVFDVDNTLVSFGAPALSPTVRNFLLKLEKMPGIHCISLASNNPRRLTHITSALNVQSVQPSWYGFKPLSSYYRRVLRHTDGDPASVAMIGDKLVQDIWGANRMGMTTVLVRPLGRDNWFDRILFTRWWEKRQLRRYLPDHIERWF